MSVLTRLLTYEDLREIPDDGCRYELFDGALIAMSSATPHHQRLSVRLAMVLDRTIVVTGLGEVFAAPLDVRFADNTVLQPDLIVVRQERLQIVGANCIEGPPDLVVEILSPSTRGNDLGWKMDRYARFGVPEYWIVDSERRQVAVYQLAGGRYVPVPQEAGQVRSATFPTLVVALDRLFADPL